MADLGRAVPAAAQLPDPDRPGRARPRAPRVPPRHLHARHADRAAVRRAAAAGGQRRGSWRTWPRASSSPRWPRTVARTATTRCCRPSSRGCSSTSSDPGRPAELYADSARLLEAEGQPREALRAYAMADDFASVARVLAAVRRRRWRWTRRPDPVDPGDDDPWLALVRARRLQRERRGRGGRGRLPRRGGAVRRLGVPSPVRGGAGGGQRVARGRDGPGPAAARTLATPRGAAQAVRAATRRLPGADRLPRVPARRRASSCSWPATRSAAARTLAHVVARLATGAARRRPGPRRGGDRRR